MFNSVQYVRDLAKAKGIPISQLERDCGFSNGYLNPRKLTKLPYDRALALANRLEVPVTEVLEGPQEPRPVTDADIKFALFGGDGEITDDMYQEVLRFADYIKNRGPDKKE